MSYKQDDKQRKWDLDFLAMAKWWALRRSKDPSTKVGAVITTPQNGIVSIGYNGFAMGVNDFPDRYADREIKYALVVHAERNAMHFASQSLRGCTLYTWPFMPCTNCAGDIIQKGIKRVVAPKASEELEKRWGKSLELARLQFKEAGVLLELIDFVE